MTEFEVSLKTQQNSPPTALDVSNINGRNPFPSKCLDATRPAAPAPITATSTMMVANNHKQRRLWSHATTLHSIVVGFLQMNRLGRQSNPHENDRVGLKYMNYRFLINQNKDDYTAQRDQYQCQPEDINSLSPVSLGLSEVACCCCCCFGFDRRNRIWITCQHQSCLFGDWHITRDRKGWGGDEWFCDGWQILENRSCSLLLSWQHNIKPNKDILLFALSLDP